MPIRYSGTLFYDRLDDPLSNASLEIYWNEHGLVHLAQSDLPLRQNAQAAPGEALRLFPALPLLLAGERIAPSQFRYTLEGTPFQQAVWQRIATIPYGETISYRQLAADIGHSAAVRAAGAACGKNPLPLIIPCHRVMGTGGGLGGFLWGVNYKRALLMREQKAAFILAA